MDKEEANYKNRLEIWNQQFHQYRKREEQNHKRKENNIIIKDNKCNNKNK